MGYFEKFNDKAEKPRFRLKAGNHEIILASEGYESTSARDNCIASVQTNSQIDERYEDRESSNGKPYFVLKAANSQVIGKSELYESTQARDKGKASVKANGATSEMKDV